MADGERVTTYLEVDVTNFKRGISDANRYVRLANSEFNKATAGIGRWQDSAEGLTAKLNQLDHTLAGQEAALRVLRAEYERVCAEQGENSTGAQELAIKLNKQEAACKKTAAQMRNVENALEEMESGADEATGCLVGAAFHFLQGVFNVPHLGGGLFAGRLLFIQFDGQFLRAGGVFPLLRADALIFRPEYTQRGLLAGQGVVQLVELCG